MQHISEFFVGEMIIPCKNPVGWSMYEKPDTDCIRYDLEWTHDEMTGTILEVTQGSHDLCFLKVLTSKGQTGWILKQFAQKLKF